MRQPEFLKTDQHVHWAWGRGNDVWAMFVAAAEGDVARMGELVASDSRLVRCQWEYRTPLYFAVLHNQSEAVAWLLERGVDASANVGREGSLIEAAEIRGYQELARQLAEHLQEQHGICAAGDEVAASIRDRDASRSQELIEQHGPDVADERGNKPIHWAVMTRQIPLIDSLLETGANINAMRPDGARPLDLTNGDYHYRGWRDLHPAAMQNHWPLVGYLVARGADYDITTACRVGDIERVREILENNPSLANADVPYSTWYSGLPLRSAAKAGYLEIVQLLLDHGADPNKPEHGLAPWGGALFDSVQNNHVEVARLLLEHRANPNQQMESGANVLWVADHVGVDHELRELLIERGAIPWEETAEAKIEDAGPDGLNWLGVHELHRCDTSRCQELIATGCDLDPIDDEYQSTPLGWAARLGDLRKVQLLLEAGADPTTAGAAWATPLAWAANRPHQEIEKLLTVS